MTRVIPAVFSCLWRASPMTVVIPGCRQPRNPDVMTDSTCRTPPRALPVLYFGAAHVSLAAASLAAASWPRAVAGFFYPSWLVGLVHLVTLGWITFSILGAMYLVGPVALRMPVAAGRADYVAFAFAVVGLA